MADPKIVSKSKTTCACGSGCNCGCGYGLGAAWCVLKWVVGILILFIVFFLGVKAGEFRVEFHDLMYGRYGNEMMMDRQGTGGFVPPITVSPAATGTATGTPVGL